jgi:tRNA(fMet)-specific endonuclease VapC
VADYFLDTDVSIEIINHPGVWDKALWGHHIVISSVTAYELAVGVEKATSKRTIEETRGFLAAIEILEFETEAALESARVRAELEASGLGIGPYDTLIAGHCRVLGFTLISNNQREFERVNELSFQLLSDLSSP